MDDWRRNFVENLKTTFLHMRLSPEREKQLNILAKFCQMSKSAYIDRLISSTYYRFFDKEGNLLEDKESNINNII